MAVDDPSKQYDPTEVMPLEDEDLAAFGERLENLPLDEAEWVARLFAECRRARASESLLLSRECDAGGQLQDLQMDLAQIVLDAAEWLRTLWAVGYMGGSRFPSAPRSDFPAVEVEDVLKSALFARIRQGKRPLPFPPPTRGGVPWHELVELEGPFQVRAEIQRDADGKAVGVAIEDCPHWDILDEIAPAQEYLVQHQAKGPVYRLALASSGATLTREPPRWTREILLQERRGFRSFVLHWPKPDTTSQAVPLRAATWDRAEAEALHWIALHHPEMYGQVRFERLESNAQ